MYKINSITDSIHSTYQLKYKVGEYEIEYCGGFERGQGGPYIAFIRINDKLIDGEMFGGPPLISEDNILVPIFLLPGTDFGIARINLKTLELTVFDNVKENLILLLEVKGNDVFYKTSFRSEIAKHVPLH